MIAATLCATGLVVNLGVSTLSRVAVNPDSARQATSQGGVRLPVDELGKNGNLSS
jgi:hypothetical protein